MGGQHEYVTDGCIVVSRYWLSWDILTGGILEDYGLDPREHPDVMDELNQSVGEAVIDTILQGLDDHASDPRIAAALREARGETG